MIQEKVEIRTDKSIFSIDDFKSFFNGSLYEISIIGWFFFKDIQDAHLKVLIDNKEIDAHIKRIVREDVAEIYKKYRVSNKCGFAVFVEIPKEKISVESKIEIYLENDHESEIIVNEKLSAFKLKNEMVYHIDQVQIINEKYLKVMGWGIQLPNELTKKSIGIIEIQVENEEQQNIDVNRVNKIRKDANQLYLPKEEICFESGFEVQWEIQEDQFYTIVFGSGKKQQREIIDVKEKMEEMREKRRHYINVWDMIKHKDNELWKDDRAYIKKYGLSKYKKHIKARFAPTEKSYNDYFWKHKASKEMLEKQRRTKFNYEPKISIAVPTYNTPIKYLTQMIESVIAQSYSNWELCIADGSEGNKKIEKILQNYHHKDDRIVYKINDKNLGIAGNTNAALSLATGEYIALLDHDDLLAPEAIFEVVKVINEKEEADVIYTDEDKISEDVNDHFGPAFKPDFNLDLLRSNNYICHFFVAKKEIVDRIEGFRSAYDGSQDYDFIFRCVEQAKRIYHIPKILYYWRCHENSVAGNPESKLYAYEAGRRAIEDHLKRREQPYDMVERLPYWGLYRVKYSVIEKAMVSIIIPNMDHVDDLDRCVKAILNKTTYNNYEILIVENNSKEKETFDYYEEIIKKDNIRVIYWDKEFNYSAINNFGVKNCQGEYIIFLNNDTEVISENWLEVMLGNCQRKEVGIVGAKLYFQDDTIQHAGVVIGLGGFAGHVLVGEDRESLGYCAKALIQQDYSAVTAACLMISKSLFYKVGGFEEKLTVAFNDVDLCLKVGKENRLVVFEPNVELYHYESKSRGHENTYEKDARFKMESDFMCNKWKTILEEGDSYYNINFTLTESDYSLRK